MGELGGEGVGQALHELLRHAQPHGEGSGVELRLGLVV